MFSDSIKFPDDIYYLIYQNLELIFDSCEQRIDGIICNNLNTLVEYTEEIMKIPILGIKINEEIIQYRLVDFIDESNNDMFKGKFEIKIVKDGNNSDIVLGIPFFKKYSCILDFSKREMIL